MSVTMGSWKSGDVVKNIYVEKKRMKVYLAGPMTWIPHNNIPAFDAAAEDLRARDYEVISPAELDDPETRAVALASLTGAPGSENAGGETWGDFLARDVKVLADQGIQAIYVLPGWQASRGARLETFVGKQMLKLPICEYPSGDLVPFGQLVSAWVWGV